VKGALASPDRTYRTNKVNKQVLRNLRDKGAVRYTQENGGFSVQVLAKASTLV
jgi:hypothetical protein